MRMTIENLNRLRGMTLKQAARFQYVELCKEFNRACAGLPGTSSEFVILSLRLHAAKGWPHIAKYMCAPCWVRSCGV
jgi:hypothetical protein